MSFGAQATVLLIEADMSLRRLITLGLQYRGMQVIEAASFVDMPPFPAQQPDLLVLDVDCGIASDWSLLAAIQAHPMFSALPVLVLTWDEPVLTPKSMPTLTDSLPHASGIDVEERMECLTKPFDARMLHSTIERMLTTNALRKAVRVQELAHNPEIVHVPASPSPSIWPLITAAGLLIAFIGLMGTLAITAGGLLIVLVSLLLWTLMPTTKPEQAALPLP
jgi:DNA-binding NtrC family response regulator